MVHKYYDPKTKKSYKIDFGKLWNVSFTIDALEMLTTIFEPEEVGKIMSAFVDYARYGTIPDLGDKAKVYFDKLLNDTCRIAIKHFQGSEKDKSKKDNKNVELGKGTIESFLNTDILTQEYKAIG